MRAFALCCAVLATVQSSHLHAQGEGLAPLSLLDVPFISQSELLCGGAAAAMVLRYWGERGITAESFANLVDRSAAGIRADTLVADLRRRGWIATGIEGDNEAMRAELARGRPVLTLIEDRPSTFHYIVILAWHERGVVFHDPARAPFLVMSTGEFDRRWRAANRWMAVVVPAASGSGVSLSPGGGSPGGPDGFAPQPPTTPCDRLVAEGVRHAQSSDLEAAERTLSSAIGCPAAMRELAGVRVLQKRWAEAADLASAAVASDRQDAYAWKVLGTSRFVQNDRLGALAAWNHVGEPRLDLLRFDGLTRTRHRAVERLVDVEGGEVLTAGRFTRARRRLAELPSATSTRLEYVPVPLGLAELRGLVAERPLLPVSRLSLAAIGLSAAATRELRLTSGSMVGAGEQISIAWRFWPRRSRVAIGMDAPAPWGGVWSVHAFSERQPFSESVVPRAERTGARLSASDWLTGLLRWSVAAGVDEWAAGETHGALAASLRFVSVDDRIDARIGTDAWLGRAGFATGQAVVRARSSPDLRGVVFVAAAAVQGASRRTPLDLWWAGDTGHVRTTLLRAHPVLGEGRLRVDRLGRTLVHGSLEAQRWWMVAGPVHAAAAAFGDIGRTGRRLEGPPHADVDVGLGARLAVTGVPGIFKVDAARGLRDGATAVSFVYEGGLTP
jgi:hypothetical protein